MAVRRLGGGPDLVLFHGGMGSWKHWIRNVEPLAEYFTVHALDHPSYGDSAPVPRETRPAVPRPGARAAPRGVAGRRPAPVRRLLVRRRDRGQHGPAPRAAGQPSRPDLARRLPDAQVRRAADPQLQGGRQRRAPVPRDLPPQPAREHAERSRQRLRGGGGYPGGPGAENSLRQSKSRRRRHPAGRPRGRGATRGRIRLLWGERDDSAFRPAKLLIGEIEGAVPNLDVHRVPEAGHWSAYENAPEVNRLLLEFFRSAPEERS
jgi:pimeloyl-ACP methyl ester carboxylesterase